MARPDPAAVRPGTLRALPARLQQEHQLLPFGVSEGALLVAGPAVPDDAAMEQVRRQTRLEPRFHLIMPSDFERLRARCRRLSPAARYNRKQDASLQ